VIPKLLFVLRFVMRNARAAMGMATRALSRCRAIPRFDTTGALPAIFRLLASGKLRNWNFAETLAFHSRSAYRAAG
jgi:hypothetical protein